MVPNGKDWSKTRAYEQRKQIDDWLAHAISALIREYRQTDREEFSDAAHYIEMVRTTFEEKLGKEYLKFETKDLGL